MWECFYIGMLESHREISDKVDYHTNRPPSRLFLIEFLNSFQHIAVKNEKLKIYDNFNQVNFGKIYRILLQDKSTRS